MMNLQFERLAASPLTFIFSPQSTNAPADEVLFQHLDLVRIADCVLFTIGVEESSNPSDTELLDQVLSFPATT
jgi:hypothetical protein